MPLGRGRYNSPQRVDRAPLGPKAAGPREDQKQATPEEGAETQGFCGSSLVPKLPPPSGKGKRHPLGARGNGVPDAKRGRGL